MAEQDQPSTPMNRPLTEGEVIELVLRGLRGMAERSESFAIQQFVNAEALANVLGFSNPDRIAFAKMNRDSLPFVANSLISRLFRAGILEPNFIDGHPFVHAVIPASKIQGLESTRTVSDHELSLTVERIHSSKLRGRMLNQAAIGASSDTMVREAVTIVEDELRNKSGLGRDTCPGREDLAARSFNTDKGKLRHSAEKSVQQGIMRMFQGYFAAIANDTHHRLTEISPHNVAQIMFISDYLMSVIEESELIGTD